MTLQKWEIFQDEVTKFLNKYFNANFTMEGGYDSTTSYITVRKATQDITTIEAKFGSTQAGQIVLISDGSKFIFCDKSKNNPNVHTQEIIKYLNSNYSLYKGVNTASIYVDISDTILYNWVKTIYREKNVEWIISSKKFNNLTVDDLLFIPINDIENYFDISLVFRRKKTGDTHIPGKDIIDFKTQLDLICQDYQIKKTNNKYLLTLNSRLSDFNIGSKYLLSMTNVDCQYYIKKKGINTNPNIMFQLNLKDNIEFKGENFKEKYKL
ncbi:MAG: hypothetical protein KAJ49_02725 [Arcobacteraceae bacterium]|nr:hypothetical protein [Arcobacteraceae bacterium]